jgi:hypothetical protein
MQAGRGVGRSSETHLHASLAVVLTFWLRRSYVPDDHSTHTHSLPAAAAAILGAWQGSEAPTGFEKAAEAFENVLEGLPEDPMASMLRRTGGLRRLEEQGASAVLQCVDIEVGGRFPSPPTHTHTRIMPTHKHPPALREVPMT